MNGNNETENPGKENGENPGKEKGVEEEHKEGAENGATAPGKNSIKKMVLRGSGV